ncbi:unnamed protein product [Protopolystoma xenopodis]|uniref:Uncharacterized protein n=1 Tax=Protopolystoma xenopodis TaxID=117903 RepID=A0A448X0Y1_9PLAT|nr:unnamed protein product [Protopolystoma xenopodis]
MVNPRGGKGLMDAVAPATSSNAASHALASCVCQAGICIASHAVGNAEEHFSWPVDCFSESAFYDNTTAVHGQSTSEKECRSAIWTAI